MTSKELEVSGWMLDVYNDIDGVKLWIIQENGERTFHIQPFSQTFYAAGPNIQLRELWRLLQHRQGVMLDRAEKIDPFTGENKVVLTAAIEDPSSFPRVFYESKDSFPDLEYYNADIPTHIRHAAQFGSFPLVKCRLCIADDLVRDFSALNDPWELDPLMPDLKILEIKPDCSPRHANPRNLILSYEKRELRLSLDMPRALIANLTSIISKYDPDIILTQWGDSWLLRELTAWFSAYNYPQVLNRDITRGLAYKDETTFTSYGSVFYRSEQTLLWGRHHIDSKNTTIAWDDYRVPGILEAARVSSMPIQETARRSPGAGITAIQIRQALKMGILVPYRRQMAEPERTALDLLEHDMGGLIYQPIAGLHANVGAFDFTALFPHLTTLKAVLDPDISKWDYDKTVANPEDFLPQALSPLLKKRINLKNRLLTEKVYEPQLSIDKNRATALKTLLVVSYGFLGFHAARFGSISAHQAVTFYSREALLRGKEAAEDMGFEFLHGLIDSLFVIKAGAEQVDDFMALSAEITKRTGIPIVLDGIFKWLAFLRSRVNPRVSVPTCYFGAFQDGTTKVRGIECRRKDTAPWIANTQTGLIDIFARAPTATDVPAFLPEAMRFIQRSLTDLREDRVPIEDLLVSQKLSRKLENYQTPSPAARAAIQLRRAGKDLKPGERVSLHFLMGNHVHAWDLPDPVDRRRLDKARYQELLLRAARVVFEGLELESLYQAPRLFD